MGERYKITFDIFSFPSFGTAPQPLSFPQNGASSHFALLVEQFLGQKLGSRWVGRGVPAAWPLRFPDLSSFDSFL